MRTYHIYALADPETGIVRYVGKTQGVPGTRRSQHIQGTSSPTTEWVKSLPAPPFFVLLETGEERRIPRPGSTFGTITASTLAETKWIKRFRRTVINKLTRESSTTAWD